MYQDRFGLGGTCGAPSGPYLGGPTIAQVHTLDSKLWAIVFLQHQKQCLSKLVSSDDRVVATEILEFEVRPRCLVF